MRRALGLSPEEKLDERGVYPPPDRSELVGVSAQMEELEGPWSVILTEEWLSDRELEEHFSEAPDLTAAIPGRARVRRLDVDPRLLVFDGVPEPANSLGAVRLVGEGRWAMDSRHEPAALVFPVEDHEVIFWGEAGEVRLFALRRGESPRRDVAPR